MATPGVKMGTLQSLPVDKIQQDLTNPRISKFLEPYGESPTAEQIYLALGAGGADESGSSTTFDKLRNSIITNGGIIQPIIVNRRKDGTFVCIEGNTRLALYLKFPEEKVAGNWTQIPALVYDDMDITQIDKIRLQVHLVGTREWDPYSKAKYLYYLRVKELLPFSAIVDYCGGRQKEVTESIQAFTDMEEHYKPMVSEAEFDTTRFSGFVELQKPGIKRAIVEAGFTLKDFASWIHTEKLYPLNTVRWVPRILRNAKAKEIFLKQGAKEAIRLVEKPDIKALEQANIGQLAQALAQAVYNLPWPEWEEIRANPTSENAQALNEAVIALNKFFSSTADGG